MRPQIPLESPTKAPSPEPALAALAALAAQRLRIRGGSSERGSLPPSPPARNPMGRRVSVPPVLVPGRWSIIQACMRMRVSTRSSCGSTCMARLLDGCRHGGPGAGLLPSRQVPRAALGALDPLPVRESLHR